MVQKVIRKIISGISIALIIFSILILMTVVFTRRGQAPSVLGFSVFRVLTGSMEPEYPVDTIVLVRKCDASEVNKGDVISFYTLEPEINGSIVTHRVVDKVQDGDRISFVTKGDANVIEDIYPVDQDYLIGKVIGSSVILGKLVRLMNNPLIFVFLILIPMIIILILNIKQTIDTAKQLAAEEMKEVEQTSDKPKENSEEKTEEKAEGKTLENPDVGSQT